jgi:hypothetical protein
MHTFLGDTIKFLMHNKVRDEYHNRQEEDTIETESWYTDLGNKLKSMFK